MKKFLIIFKPLRANIYERYLIEEDFFGKNPGK